MDTIRSWLDISSKEILPKQCFIQGESLEDAVKVAIDFVQDKIRAGQDNKKAFLIKANTITPKQGVIYNHNLKAAVFALLSRVQYDNDYHKEALFSVVEMDPGFYKIEYIAHVNTHYPEINTDLGDDINHLHIFALGEINDDGKFVYMDTMNSFTVRLR